MWTMNDDVIIKASGDTTPLRLPGSNEPIGLGRDYADSIINQPARHAIYRAIYTEYQAKQTNYVVAGGTGGQFVRLATSGTAIDNHVNIMSTLSF